MPTSFEEREAQENPNRLSPVTLLMAAVAVLAIAATVWVLSSPPSPKSVPAGPETVNLKMTPAEQEYLKKIEVGNVALSRAENFLHQEVTIINGDVFNGGTEPVSGLRVSAEFSDDMHQIVLREVRDVLGATQQPLTPGERRAFEISFEHVPASWNMQQPSVRASYLQLPGGK
jgi:hypothetical protein